MFYKNHFSSNIIITTHLQSGWIIMKRKILCTALFFSAFIIMGSTHNISFAASYDITEYDNANNGLINHAPPFQAGDVININNNLNATDNIGDIGDFALTINGNDYVIDGGGIYSGFELLGSNYDYTINQLTFSNFNKSSVDTTEKGSVIYNTDSNILNIVNSKFSDNSDVSQNGYALGGAIYNAGVASPAVLNITNSEFINNTTSSDAPTKDDNGGGAIFNTGNTNLSITDTTFKNNTAIAYFYSYGGAIANTGKNGQSTVLKINNSIFDGNGSISKTDTGYGGAIYNYAQLEKSSIIMDSKFTNNITTGTHARGGAIYNDRLASITINNCVFDGNTAAGSKFDSSGGAIDNRSSKTTVIRNSVFTNNTVMTNIRPMGGAIYNGGVLNLIADEGFLTFKGNASSYLDGRSTSNAIYNSNKIHINAGKNGVVSIEDKIEGDNITSSIININSTGTKATDTAIEDAPTDGNIVMLDTITKSTLNMYNGMLSLGRVGKNIVPDGSYFNNVNLNLYGGILNLANNNIDSLKVENITGKSDVLMFIDADLSDAGSIDNFTVNQSASGSVNVAGINILKDSDTDKILNVFNGNTLDFDNLSLNIYTQKNKYIVTSPSSGQLKFESSASAYGLKGAIEDASAKYRSFSMEEEENITLGLGSIAGNDAIVTIFGNMQDLNGNNNSGLTLSGGQTLKIFSVGSTSGGVVNASVHNFLKAGASADQLGGFIENNGTTDIFSSVFVNNKVIATDDISKSAGGAIYNTKDLSISYAAINGNTAMGSADVEGGGLYNSGDSSVIFTTFEGNTATSSKGDAKGGAIFNSGELTLINSNFINNSVKGETAKGGAIYNSGILNIITANADILFTGNKANGLSNAIYNEGTVNLNAGQGKNITFNDVIEGKDKTSSVININYSDDTVNARPSHGEIIFNEIVENSTINLFSGTLTPSAESNLNGNNMTLQGGILNFTNGSIGTMALDNLTIKNSPRWNLDLDLENQTGDRITANNVIDSTGKINITSINLINDAKTPNSSINIVSDNLKNYVNLGVTKAVTPIYQYNLYYDSNTGNIKIGGGPDGPLPPYQNFNPAILAAPIAAQLGSYLTQLNSYDEAFNNMDMYMLMPRRMRDALKYKNRVANAPSTEGIYSPLMYKEKEKALWFKPYSTFENVPLRNGPKVSNVSYGSFFGADSDLKELGHGFDGVFSLYAGYNGSHQAYDGIGIYQNGGVGGATAILYKGSFFSGLTANVGANSGEASTMYGRDSFTMLTAGIASKTGYNWELFNNKLIIQPNYLMSYTFVNTFDFTNQAGVRVHSSPLNAIQIAPGLRIIGNLKNGWQPYLGVNMVWNIMDRTQFKANDVSLPELSVKPYIEYGAGLQKRWGERFTGFFQVMLRNGGRNGVGLQLGFRWTI